MKKKLAIRNLCIWLIGLIFIAIMLISFYLTNPFNIPNEQLEQIQTEEGLR